MSTNTLFLRIENNPFPLYFKGGLNVSLSSDDPYNSTTPTSPS